MRGRDQALLLDANVLIAWVVGDHEHHETVVEWLTSHPGLQVAICPITEGALLRHLLRTGESGRRAMQALAGLRNLDTVVFWPADVSYAVLDGRVLRGHRQVTDEYLVALADAHDSKLVTLDRPLATRHAQRSTLLRP